MEEPQDENDWTIYDHLNKDTAKVEHGDVVRLEIHPVIDMASIEGMFGTNKITNDNEYPFLTIYEDTLTNHLNEDEEFF